MKLLRELDWTAAGRYWRSVQLDTPHGAFTFFQDKRDGLYDIIPDQASSARKGIWYDLDELTAQCVLHSLLTGEDA